ncbi:MAG: hypothetical protein PSX81_05430 [bacterium]|nr:hypothetical protein [bacterium]
METIIKPFQLAIAAELIKNYSGKTPFISYFNEQCKLHKNWGSRDRKIYRQACYAYLRLGHITDQNSIENNILLGLQNPENIASQIDLKAIYPNHSQISKTIDKYEFFKNLLVQKPVYLAVLNNQHKLINNELERNGIPFEYTSSNCIKVSANAKCNSIIDNGWAIIMDLASQKAADSIIIKSDSEVWDCCSGAGGKALFIANKYKNALKLTCSDARFSILENLKNRFRITKLALPHIELCDLKDPFQLPKKYDIIIADVPCSGSGTWGRTPEQIKQTDIQKISFYADLQKMIVKNALRNLKPGGVFYYITCSVFELENEKNVHFISQNLPLTLINQHYIHSDKNPCDYLYLAEFKGH